MYVGYVLVTVEYVIRTSTSKLNYSNAYVTTSRILQTFYDLVLVGWWGQFLITSQG